MAPYRAAVLPDGQRACIIGAGIAGLTAAKALKDCGIPYDQFELESDLGGLWRIEHRRSSAYTTLHIISSRYNMELADFPMPDDFPDYGHHRYILQYFEDYAREFDLRDGITFNTRVEHVAPVGDGRWDVTLDTGETRRYGAVLCATGHHWNPRLPDFPGAFDGHILHAHDYEKPMAFEGERVCVVGIGNSACDIAVDLSRIAERVTVSTRSSAWIIPKYLLGIPTDQWTGYYMEYLPVWVRRCTLRLLTWLTVGSQARYGVPTPDHKMLQEHPTLNQEFLSYVGHGRIHIKPNIAQLDGNQIRFEDGSAEPFDTLIYATGYDIRFPFLPESVVHVENNRVGLYRNVVSSDHSHLYFMGLIQPLGAVMPLCELQAKWVAGLLDGTMALPDANAMRRSIVQRQQKIAARYHNSPRHTIQVDFWSYVHQLEREMKAGRTRAGSVGPERLEPVAPVAVG